MLYVYGFDVFHRIVDGNSVFYSDIAIERIVDSDCIVNWNGFVNYFFIVFRFYFLCRCYRFFCWSFFGYNNLFPNDGVRVLFAEQFVHAYVNSCLAKRYFLDFLIVENVVVVRKSVGRDFFNVF